MCVYIYYYQTNVSKRNVGTCIRPQRSIAIHIYILLTDTCVYDNQSQSLVTKYMYVAPAVAVRAQNGFGRRVYYIIIINKPRAYRTHNIYIYLYIYIHMYNIIMVRA